MTNLEKQLYNALYEMVKCAQKQDWTNKYAGVMVTAYTALEAYDNPEIDPQILAIKSYLKDNLEIKSYLSGDGIKGFNLVTSLELEGQEISISETWS